MIDWNMEKGFTNEEAIIEANRCLSCKNPLCEKGCPTNMRIRDFIKEIKNNNLEQAYNIINECSSLPYICSIVCPHENQCVGHCVLGFKQKPINCGALERYVVESMNKPLIKVDSCHKKVAIIGSGPAGISCAKELAKNGCSVDIFEATSIFGGVLATGIPNYRLDKTRVERIKNELIELGVNIYYNRFFKESEIIKLKASYDAIFVAVGLPSVKRLGIKNEDFKGVYDALKYLEAVNLYTKYQIGQMPNLTGHTVVIGAGNVAMDAARCAVRNGSKVTIVYRRSRLEAPATKYEIACAEAEGVELKFLNNPVEVIGQDKVEGIKVEIMTLGEPDASGRRRPVGTNTYEEIKCDNVISAIGQNPNDIYDAKEFKTNYLYLVCDDFKTNIDDIYAGGDIVLGAKTVVLAMDSGRKVAKMILEK